jgi:hypothetical protein
MRIVFQSEDDSGLVLPDQYVLFTADGSFSIAQYLSQGYNKLDAFIVGGGGGGGGGGLGYSYPSGGTASRGGGGGGGGGGGQLKRLTGINLSSLPGSNPVVVGAGGAGGISGQGGGNLYGHDGASSSFNGITAVGGGGGANGGSALTTGSLETAGGGGGGAGAVQSVAPQQGAVPANPVPQAAGGVGSQGGGNGASSRVGLLSGIPRAGDGFDPNGDGSTYGGGGGGCGGQSHHGTNTSDNLKFYSGGIGGKGFGTQGLGANDGGLGVGGWVNSSGGTFTYYDPGHGGGGGGGHDLSSASGVANLLGNARLPRLGATDQSLPGAGGGGGGAAYLINSSVAGYDFGEDGYAGAPGCVLLKIYKV